jgi:hypothetical protein
MASHDGNNSRVCFGSLADVTRRRAIAETNSAFLAGDARCDITPLTRTGLLALRTMPAIAGSITSRRFI